MASMNKVRKRKNCYAVAFRDPYTNKRKQSYYKSKDDAVIALSHWQQVELFKKNNMDWESLLYKQQAPITVGEVFTAFTKQKPKITKNPHTGILEHSGYKWVTSKDFIKNTHKYLADAIEEFEKYSFLF